MKGYLASLFKIIFHIKAFKKHFFGVHTRLFKRYKLFKGITKRIRYDKQILLDLDINDWIPQNLYFLGQYEEKEIRFLRSLLQPGDVFLDIGANVGLYTLVASSIVGDSGKVYAFEPYSKNFLSLNHHLQLNNCSNVIARQVAVSEKKGWLTLKGNDDGNNGMMSAYADQFNVSEKVAAVSMDEYFSSSIEKPIRLIKIDIEGGEYDAIRGMANLLRKHQPVIMLEINHEILTKAGVTAGMLEEELLRLQYVKHYLDANGSLITTKSPNDHSYNCVFLPAST